MAKPLTRNEIHVLQENLDLFGELQPEDDTTPIGAQSAPYGKSGRNTKKRKVASSKPAKQAFPQTPATQDLLDLPAQETSNNSAMPKIEPENMDSKPETTMAEQANQPEDGSPTEADGPQLIYLAVRAKSATTAKDFLESHGIQVENYAMEKRDPTLRNIHEALLDQGLEYRQNDNIIHWALINHDQPPARLLTYDMIEVAFEADWLETHKQSIRRLKGGDYLDACANIARQLQIKQPATNGSVSPAQAP